MNTRKVVVTLAVAAALVASACSGSDAEPTAQPTTTAQTLPLELPDLEFGEGVMPFTVPSNFPMPVQSKISTTMIDGTRELTEVVFNVGGNIHDVKAFYTTNLPRLGYEITNVADRVNETTLSIVGNGIDGEVRLKAVSQTLTTGVLLFVLT